MFEVDVGEGYKDRGGIRIVASYRLTDREVSYIATSAMKYYDCEQIGDARITINPELNRDTFSYDGSVEWSGTIKPVSIPYSNRENIAWPNPDDGMILGVAFQTDHDIDTVFESDTPLWDQMIGNMSVSRKVFLPPDTKETWTCPYCAAMNYTKIGHCYHCASPRRGN